MIPKVTFGHPYGPHIRLHSELMDYEPASGLSYVWRRLIQHADHEVLEDILSALKQGGTFRNTILISAICNGWDGMTSPLGQSKKLKRTARRFSYHCIATIDSAVPDGAQEIEPELLSQRRYGPLITSMQRSYIWLTPPSKLKPQGRLTEEESLLANVYCLVKVNTKRTLESKAVHLIADNYGELEKYLGYIAGMESLTVSDVQKLLESKPELALAEGAL